MAELSRLVVSVARSPEELLEAHRLRHEIYLAHGMVGRRPDALELDAWDPVATTFVARRLDGDDPAGRIVGSIRVCGEVDGAFPMEEHGFRLPGWLPRSSARETSRWVARPSRSARTGLGLTIAVDHWLRAQGLTHSISVVLAPSLRALARGPWPILPLGPGGTVALDGGRPLSVQPICMPVLPVPPAPPEGIEIDVRSPAPAMPA